MTAPAVGRRPLTERPGQACAVLDRAFLDRDDFDRDDLDRDDLDRDDLAAVEAALRAGLSVRYRCSFARQSSGTEPAGPGTPCSAG